jgi:hypothetical protein
MRKILPVLTIAALSLSASGCSDKAPAVAHVEVTPSTLRLGYPELQTLHLNWQPVAPLEGVSVQPTVFLHLRDSKNEVVRTFDHPFPQKWREGTPVAYDAKLFQSLLAPPLAPGKYRLTLGLYEGKTRWPVGISSTGAGEKIDKREYAAATVEVPTGATAPSFAFSPSWLPVEDGNDKYVVARRWLNGRGVIGIKDVREAGSVWLLLRIPSGKEPNEQLQVEGGGIPSVLVRGTCGGMETNISGPGMHELDIPVDGPSPLGVCRIALIPNFTITSAVTHQVRSVSLENAAWAPASVHAPAPAGQPASPTAPSPTGQAGT